MSDTINHFKEACESPLSSRGNRTRKLIDNPPAKGISLDAKNIYQNLSIPALVEHALRYEPDSLLTSSGALATVSYAKTGRSPKDKRVVDEPTTTDDVWWGPINIPLKPESFQKNLDLAISHFNKSPRLYVIDAFAGWSPEHRLKIRIICKRPYHAMFIKTMLIRPTAEELKNFGEPDWTIYNAGDLPADESVEGVDSDASVALNFASHEMVILGTQYAGEMKKGVFTIMNHKMPKEGHLSLHSSANVSADGKPSLFFGLSGTGKTTLSTEPHRKLIGDDEHVWTDTGIFNIEGGCYAKAICLRADKEPEIVNAIKFGAVLENIQLDHDTRVVDFDDIHLTMNTRVAYPLEHIDNAILPAMAGHPTNIILLTCDAFGVLPPISLLTPEQLMYHFISGYTAKVAGTEMGITEPVATFSPCFGAPFLVWHPAVYAKLLAEKVKKHGCKAWLINTGWTGGKYGVGKRMNLKATRASIDAIHSGALENATFTQDKLFGLQTPTSCPGMPTEYLNPSTTWKSKEAYDQTAAKLASLFDTNFKKFASGVSEEVLAAGPNMSNTPASKTPLE